MIVIATAQQKGGVGKSTLLINLAIEAQSRKKQVCLVDFDAQASCVHWKDTRGENPPPVFTGKLIDAEAIVEELKGQGFDFAFLDLPGRHGVNVTAGIRAADFVLVPTRPVMIDFEPSSETVGAIYRVNTAFAYVLNIASPSKKDIQMFKEAVTEAGHTVVPQVIFNRAAYPKAIEQGRGVSELDPKSVAAQEIKSLWKWIERQTHG